MNAMIKPAPTPVDILILGAGWTSTFLIPLIASSSRSKTLSNGDPIHGANLKTTGLSDAPLTYAATSTTSRPDALNRPTIPFRFDPSDDNLDAYALLPSAQTVLITFPLTGTGQSKHLVSSYRKVHGAKNNFIQLGSTGIFTGEQWNTHASPHDTKNARAIAEDELIQACGGVVLNLAGLYGGPRDPRDWVTRVAKSKSEVEGKKALHLVHGEDVARGVLGVHFGWDKAVKEATAEKQSEGKRWLLTDLRVYDWWDLIQTWGPLATERYVTKASEEEAKKLKYAEWVGELMVEHGVRALPRGADTLGRVLDSREFWQTIGVWPVSGRVMS